MKIYICAGKGGVGKTTSAASIAFELAARGEQTAILDFDGGRSMCRTLRISIETPNVLREIQPCLQVAAIDAISFTGIEEAQATGHTFESYASQFPGDLGLVPFADMLFTFFGGPTDIELVQEMGTLIRLLHELEAAQFAHVLIDVEPTKGLGRFLRKSSVLSRSLQNLQNRGLIALTAIGAFWPDIKAYLKSPYIQNAPEYCARLEHMARLMQGAVFLIVCTPEREPIEQTSDIRQIIEGSGGQVYGYVVNRVAGKEYEARNIAKLPRHVPILCINEHLELHGNDDGREAVLRKMGNVIASLLP